MLFYLFFIKVIINFSILCLDYLVITLSLCRKFHQRLVTFNYIFFLLYTIYVRKNHQDHHDEVPMIYWANELCSHFFTQVSFVSSRKIYIIAVADVIILSQSINMWVEVTWSHNILSGLRIHQDSWSEWLWYVTFMEAGWEIGHFGQITSFLI